MQQYWQANDIIIQFANEQAIADIRNLWDICFPEDAKFNDYWFANIFDYKQALLLYKQGQLAAMTMIIPYRMMDDDICHEVTYIYGACTHPDYRKQHLMSKLLQYSFALDVDMGRKASILIPAEEWLFGFYEKMGYEACFNLSKMEMCDDAKEIPSGKIRPMQQQDLSWMMDLYNTSLKQPYVLRSNQQWCDQIAMFRALQGDVWVLENQTAFAFVWKQAQKLVVQECIAADNNACKQMVYALMECHNVSEITVFSSENSKSSEKLGCIHWHNEKSVSNIGYMNLMYN